VKKDIHLLPPATNLCLVATKSRDWLNIELKNRKKMKKCIKILHTAWKKAVCEQKRIFTFSSLIRSSLRCVLGKSLLLLSFCIFFASRLHWSRRSVMCVRYWKHMCIGINIILMLLLDSFALSSACAEIIMVIIWLYKICTQS
jgi:hypothetical protein